MKPESDNYLNTGNSLCNTEWQVADDSYQECGLKALKSLEQQFFQDPCVWWKFQLQIRKM